MHQFLLFHTFRVYLPIHIMTQTRRSSQALLIKLFQLNPQLLSCLFQLFPSSLMPSMFLLPLRNSLLILTFRFSYSFLVDIQFSIQFLQLVFNLLELPLCSLYPLKPNLFCMLSCFPSTQSISKCFYLFKIFFFDCSEVLPSYLHFFIAYIPPRLAEFLMMSRLLKYLIQVVKVVMRHFLASLFQLIYCFLILRFRLLKLFLGLFIFLLDLLQVIFCFLKLFLSFVEFALLFPTLTLFLFIILLTSQEINRPFSVIHLITFTSRLFTHWILFCRTTLSFQDLLYINQTLRLPIMRFGHLPFTLFHLQRRKFGRFARLRMSLRTSPLLSLHHYQK